MAFRQVLKHIVHHVAVCVILATTWGRAVIVQISALAEQLVIFKDLGMKEFITIKAAREGFQMISTI